MSTDRPRARVAALAALLLLALSACAAIPMSGPVQKGDARVETQSDVDVFAARTGGRRHASADRRRLPHRERGGLLATASPPPASSSRARPS